VGLWIGKVAIFLHVVTGPGLLLRGDYLLVCDDCEWNSVKDWIRVAERAVRESHPRYRQIELPVRLKDLFAVVNDSA
jgi:hypothetical protein